jgi:hypothetical protein
MVAVLIEPHWGPSVSGTTVDEYILNSSLNVLFNGSMDWREGIIRYRVVQLCPPVSRYIKKYFEGIFMYELMS